MGTEDNIRVFRNGFGGPERSVGEVEAIDILERRALDSDQRQVHA